MQEQILAGGGEELGGGGRASRRAGLGRGAAMDAASRPHPSVCLQAMHLDSHHVAPSAQQVQIQGNHEEVGASLGTRAQACQSCTGFAAGPVALRIQRSLGLRNDNE